MRQKREQIPPGTLLLAVEDPETRVGSGGATLNALLVAAEHLSARAGFTVSAYGVPSSGTHAGRNRDGGSRQMVSKVISPGHHLASSASGTHFHTYKLGRLSRWGSGGRQGQTF